MEQNRQYLVCGVDTVDFINLKTSGEKTKNKKVKKS